MESRNDYTAVNSKTWDVWAEHGCEWSVPITHEDFVQAKAGNWGVFLTPCKTVPKDWFLPFPGTKILGLASGGGQQMPIFAALGADVTVFDNSDCQLSAERMVASRENYGIRVVKGDMTRPLPFSNGSFDLIFHPVSNCYVQEVLPIWRECFRVLRPGGVLLAGFSNPLVFLFEDSDPLRVVNSLPYDPLRNASDEEYRRMADNWEGIQFSHSLETQIGGQLLAGFRLTHLFEDYDRPGDCALREYTPTYLATRAVKPEFS